MAALFLWYWMPGPRLGTLLIAVSSSNGLQIVPGPWLWFVYWKLQVLYTVRAPTRKQSMWCNNHLFDHSTCPPTGSERWIAQKEMTVIMRRIIMDHKKMKEDDGIDGWYIRRTFQDSLTELGPVATARTLSGGPEGAASSVRNRIGSLGLLQPTSLTAKTVARKAVFGLRFSIVAFGPRQKDSERVSLLTGSFNLMTYLMMLLFPLKGSTQEMLAEVPVTFWICKWIGFSGLSVFVCLVQKAKRSFFVSEMCLCT